jgi:hypothetical protein
MTLCTCAPSRHKVNLLGSFHTLQCQIIKVFNAIHVEQKVHEHINDLPRVSRHVLEF